MSYGLEALTLLQNRCYQDQAAEAACPTLVALDMNMPVMDGLKFLEAFVKLPLPVAQHQGIVIVLPTTTLRERGLARLHQLPIADVLHKPLTEQAITKIVQDYFSDLPVGAHPEGQATD